MLFADSIEISKIYVYILRSFYYSRFPYEPSNDTVLALSPNISSLTSHFKDLFLPHAYESISLPSIFPTRGIISLLT